MGLWVSHGCWHGAYSAFHRLRVVLGKAAGAVPLASDVCGNVELHIESMSPVLLRFMEHSDCDGSIAIADLIPLAEDLEVLADKIEEMAIDPKTSGGHIERAGGYAEAARTFASGLRRAAEANEEVVFS